MIALGVWFKAIMGTFIGRAVAVALLALTALKVNNLWVRADERHKTVNRVVEKTNKQARKRNAKVRKIGDSIDPATAMQRLRSEYPDSDSN